MTLTMTLVRHGRTHFNARRVLQGRCDSPLTRDGRAGVRTTARHLADTPFTAAWSSPSGRAVATAVELLRHHDGIPLRTDRGLLEYAFGIYEQKPESVLDEVVAWSDLVTVVLAGRHPGLPGGEHARDFMDRTRDVFARIAAQHEDGHVLVVGHGLTLGAYLATVDEVGRRREPGPRRRPPDAHRHAGPVGRLTPRDRPARPAQPGRPGPHYRFGTSSGIQDRVGERCVRHDRVGERCGS